MKGALACYVEALARCGTRACGCGRRAGRRRRRRDREDAVGRRTGRRVPRLRGRLALPRHARRRRGHVHPRRADGGQGRARALRLALGAALDAAATSSTPPSARAARPELDRADARACSTPVLEWCRRWEETSEAYRGVRGDRQRRRDSGRLRLARLADAAPDRSLPRRARAADDADGGGAPRRSLDSCAALAAAPPSTGSRRRSTSPRPAPRSRRATRSSRRSTRRTRRSSAKRPSATSRAGSRTRPR